MGFRGSLKKKLGLTGESRKNVALFIDGPNLLRREFGIDLGDIKKEVESVGTLAIAKVFLNQFAPEKLIEAVSNEGMESIVTPVDPDVALAVEMMDAIYNPNIDIICVVTRDGDFQPPILKAKQHGKETIAIGVRQNLSKSLINSVDTFIDLGIITT
jgi:uncharacterized protein (TIGR00288 family)